MEQLYSISVIVPAYNCEKNIEQCIKALLEQDYPREKYEIIIVDNNSKDNTANIIKQYPVQYQLEDKVQTSYAARNRGVRAAKGEILAFTDSDCIPMKSWLSEGVKGFTEDSIGCVAGAIEASAPENYVEEFLAQKNTLTQKCTLAHHFLPYSQTANAFYRKDIFERIGYFEEKWATGGDGDFAWRMQLETPYKIKYIPESLVLHKHRSTLKSMFLQRVKWGIGRTNGYKKYKEKMKKRQLKETCWDIQTLFCLLIKVIKCYMPFNNNKCGEAERRRSLLVFLTYAGMKLGHLIGSIKNGVYCV